MWLKVTFKSSHILKHPFADVAMSGTGCQGVIGDVAYMHVWYVARYTNAQIILRVRQNTSIYNHGHISFVRDRL